MIKIPADEIMTVFRLSESSNDLEQIDFEELREVYNAKGNYFKNIPIKDLCTKVGKIVVMGPSTQEPFKIDYFDMRERSAYWALCQVFGEDVEERMPVHLMCMMVQILHSHLAVNFDYAPFIAKLIHNGSIGIQKRKVDKPFC